MKYKSFIIVNDEQLQKAYAIRRKVFIEEQNVPEELELDAYDRQEATKHVLMIDESKKAIFRPYENGILKIERVAVLQTERGTGIGKLLMERIETEAKGAKYSKLKLSAQLHAQKFYEKLGYQAQGEIYLDAGIEHIDMMKDI